MGHSVRVMQKTSGNVTMNFISLKLTYITVRLFICSNSFYTFFLLPLWFRLLILKNFIAHRDLTEKQRGWNGWWFSQGKMTLIFQKDRKTRPARVLSITASEMTGLNLVKGLWAQCTRSTELGQQRKERKSSGCCLRWRRKLFSVNTLSLRKVRFMFHFCPLRKDLDQYCSVCKF